MSLRALVWCAVSTVAQANEDEKYSLPSQEADAKAMCEREGWQIVDILRVPGHSRDYKSIDKLAADAAAKGIDAFYKLIQHLEKCDFDVLICRDANRFARRASLMAYVVESIVDDCGRRIYSFNDGWVDKQNAGMFAAMKGYAAAQDIKFLVEARRRGMHARAERGLLVSSRDPFSHVTVRDAGGKALRTEVNERLRRLWDDAATLILEGVSWPQIEAQLYERFGHVDDTGRAFQPYMMYYTVMSPTTWGHIAIGRYSAGSLRGTRAGAWAFDVAEPAPDGVTVYRDAIPPLWTGALAERLKAEIRRRMDTVKGRAYSDETHRYSSVFVCGVCGGGMIYMTGNRFVGLRCANTIRRQRGEYLCAARGVASIRSLDKQIDAILRRRLDGVALAAPNETPESDGDALARLETELVAVNAQLERLIYEQSMQSESVQARYRTTITSVSERLDTLERAAAIARHKSQQTSAVIEQEAQAANDLREMTIENFWQASEREQNQFLHRLLVNRQFVLLNKEIVGTSQRKRAIPRRLRTV